MLRAFALRLIARHSQYGVRLVISEPGYMHVDVTDRESAFASVLVSLDSNDGTSWHYKYNLASEAGDPFELEFDAAGIDDAVEQLHVYATGRKPMNGPTATA